MNCANKAVLVLLVVVTVGLWGCSQGSGPVGNREVPHQRANGCDAEGVAASG